MKKYLTWVAALGLAAGCLGGCKAKAIDHEMINGEVALSEKNFPDETFRNYVTERFDNDENGSLSEEEIRVASSMYLEGVTDTTGLEIFSELSMLFFDEGSLAELDVSKNRKLTVLCCDGNQLTKLDVSKNKEIWLLTCEKNQLTELDVSQNPKLEHLDVTGNRLTKLNVDKNYRLSYLKCSGNNLKSLNVGKCAWEINLEADDEVVIDRVDKDADSGPAIDAESFPDKVFREYILANVDRDENGILSEREAKSVVEFYFHQYDSSEKIRDLTGLKYFTDLELLDCSDSELSSLDLRGNPELREVLCQRNHLTELDVSKNTKLTELMCYDNRLVKLDVSNSPELSYLGCGSNQIKELDCSKNHKLYVLDCAYNPLDYLNLNGVSPSLRFNIPSGISRIECSDELREKLESEAVDY